MEVVLGEKIGVPCPVCDADLVSANESRAFACPQCKLEFTDSQLREFWGFL